MARLVLGPVLRHVGARDATIWVETDAACSVEVRRGRAQGSARTFRVARHHYAVIVLRDLEPGSADAYEVSSKVNSMFAGRPARDRPVVESDSYSNAVTVIAKDEDLKTIENLIGRLDKIAEVTNVQVKVLPVKGMRLERRLAQSALKGFSGEIKVTECVRGFVEAHA